MLPLMVTFAHSCKLRPPGVAMEETGMQDKFLQLQLVLVEEYVDCAF